MSRLQCGCFVYHTILYYAASDNLYKLLHNYYYYCNTRVVCPSAAAQNGFRLVNWGVCVQTGCQTM